MEIARDKGQDRTKQTLSLVRIIQNWGQTGTHPYKGCPFVHLNDREIDQNRLAKERTHTLTTLPNTIIRLWGIDLHPTRPHQTPPERTCQRCVRCQQEREKRAQATAQAGGIETTESEQNHP